MTPSEIREELLAQHASIRGQIEAARLIVERWARGEAPRALVHNALAALADTLRRHNLREESVLRELVRSVDAWGEARVEIMEEGHVREHNVLFDAVLTIADVQDPHDAVREMERLRTHLLEHMAREEETFLNVSVLRDDCVAIDAYVG